MYEVNFDGLVGPTHNYAGLSYGNVASLSHKSSVSSPKQAALQGLNKAKAIADMGLVQGIIPPQMRPDFESLRGLGFVGSDEEVLKKAFQENPLLLSICYSSSFMWTANAATVAPSCDTTDKKVHLTPANLRAKPHRAIEPKKTYKTLKTIFNNESFFSVHPDIGLGDAFSDEGAANHTRFESPKTKEGLHFFVYGREALNPNSVAPKRFPARQTLEGSQAVARGNHVDPKKVLYAQQNPDVIDAGVFHNDVISVGYKNVLLFHELAFLNTEDVISQIDQRLNNELVAIKVKTSEVSLEAAVKSYLFNSQIIEPTPGKMCLVAPENCKLEPSVKRFIDKMIAATDNPVDEVIYFDLMQSMQNGGGPACLRLRVQLTEKEIKAINQSCLINDDKYNELVSWVNKHYREELSFNDLADYKFANEVTEALYELEGILSLNGLYQS